MFYSHHTCFTDRMTYSCSTTDGSNLNAYGCQYPSSSSTRDTRVGCCVEGNSTHLITKVSCAIFGTICTGDSIFVRVYPFRDNTIPTTKVLSTTTPYRSYRATTTKRPSRVTTPYSSYRTYRSYRTTTSYRSYRSLRTYRSYRITTPYRSYRTYRSGSGSRTSSVE